MIVTIIMILTDWLMVGVTKMVYSCKVAYRQGMLFSGTAGSEDDD